MAKWIIGRLDTSHDRAAFDCGHSMLNAWIKERASQYDRRDLCRTFVATHPNELAVFGFYAISSYRVVYDALPVAESKGLPHLDLPVVLIGRLAVDRSQQGKGLSSFLLVDALRRSADIPQQLGIRAVEVHAIDVAARDSYLKFGFRPLLDDSHQLLLPMHEVRKLRLDPIE